MTRFRFLILWTLIFIAHYCYANQKPNKNAPISSSKDNGDTPTLKFSYIIEDPKTKIPCTLANMSIAIVVNYKMSDDKVATKNVTIPSNAVAKGTCEPVISTLSLVWGTKVNEEVQQNVVKFLLFNDRTKFSVFSADVDLFLDPANFPNAADERRITKSKIDLGLFQTPIDAGQYKCCKEERIKVDNDTVLILTDVSLIAFNTMENYTQWNDDDWHDIPGIGLPHSSEAAFNYIVRNPMTKIACTLANMAISVKLRYKTKNNEEKQTTFAMPTNANVSGNCGLTNSIMTLSWTPKGAVVNSMGFNRPQNSISLIFNADISTFHVSMISVDFYLDEENFPGAADSMQGRYTMNIDNLNLFNSHKMGVYKCDSESVEEFYKLQLTFSDVAIIASNSYWDVSHLGVERCRLQRKVYILLIMWCVLGSFFACFIIGIAIYLIIKCLRQY